MLEVGELPGFEVEFQLNQDLKPCRRSMFPRHQRLDRLVRVKVAAKDDLISIYHQKDPTVIWINIWYFSNGLHQPQII